MRIEVSNNERTDTLGASNNRLALMHSGDLNVPRLFRSTEVGLADECLPAEEGHPPRAIAVRGLANPLIQIACWSRKNESFLAF